MVSHIILYQNHNQIKHTQITEYLYILFLLCLDCFFCYTLPLFCFSLRVWFFCWLLLLLDFLVYLRRI